jgi:hypothetical protein
MSEVLSTTLDNAASVEKLDSISTLLLENEEETPVEGTPKSTTQSATEGQGMGEEEEDDGNQEDDKQEGEGDEADEDISWAKALGVEDSQLVLDEDGTLKGINVKVDGESSTVGLKDLIAGYQTNKYVTQKSQALSAERKEFDAHREKFTGDYTAKLNTAEKLTGILASALLKEYNDIDWNHLRTTNPGEYAAAQADFQKRQGHIEQIMASVETEKQELDTKAQEEFKQRQQAFVMEQFQKVIVNNPQWNDHDKMRSDLNAMADVLNSAYGITPEEFAMVTDARHIEILKDAAAYRKGKETVQQKTVNKPKFVSSKSERPRKPMDKVTQLVLNARKATGYKQRELQRDAVAEILTGL